MSQTLNFRDLTQRHLINLIEEIKSLNLDINSVNSAKLIVHEASHYLDHLATLSGQKMLLKIYNALNEYELYNAAVNENKTPTVNLNYIIDFLNTFNYWKQSQYATLIQGGSHYPGFQNWSYNFNTALGMDIYNKPNGKELLTVTFNHRGTPFVRVPFSIESLWETNAMWAEIYYHYTVASLLDEGIRQVEGNDMQKKYEKYLYDPKLFVYSVAAHLTSSFASIGDIPSAFKLSKALSSISLNLPIAFYKQIKRTRGTLFNGLVNRLNNSSNFDPSIIFLALLENTIESGIGYNELENEHGLDIDKILFINNLPDKSILKEEILAELNKLSLQINGPHNELYTFHKNKGIALFSELSIEGGINEHPAFLIEIARNSQACIFQGWDEDAFEEEESEAFKRQEYFEKLFNLMIT